MANKGVQITNAPRRAPTTPAEQPTVLESLGRGYMDVIDPLLIGYEYLSRGPEAGASYRSQKADELARYQAGMSQTPGGWYDPVRSLGRVALTAPFMGSLGGLLSTASVAQAGDTAANLAKRAVDWIDPPDEAQRKRSLLARILRGD